MCVREREREGERERESGRVLSQRGEAVRECANDH